MNKSALSLICSGLLLVGAGCASASPFAAPPAQPAAPRVEAPAPAPTAAGQKAVGISGFSFAPASMTVSAGTTVVWTNQDPMAHTITADDGSFDSGTIASGATYNHAFTQSGTFPYHCSVHPSMKGTIVVQ